MEAKGRKHTKTHPANCGEYLIKDSFLTQNYCSLAVKRLHWSLETTELFRNRRSAYRLPEING